MAISLKGMREKSSDAREPVYPCQLASKKNNGMTDKLGSWGRKAGYFGGGRKINNNANSKTKPHVLTPSSLKNVWIWRFICLVIFVEFGSRLDLCILHLSHNNIRLKLVLHLSLRLVNLIVGKHF